jgi:hypothetical protein
MRFNPLNEASLLKVKSMEGDCVRTGIFVSIL